MKAVLQQQQCIMTIIELSKEVQFILIIIGSIFIGIPLRYLKRPTSRKFLPAAIGLTMVLVFCRMQAFHSLLCFIVIASLIKLRVTYLVPASFTWLFSYLFFMSHLQNLGFEKQLDVTKTLHFIVTLKLISIACDISDFRRRLKNDEKSKSTIYIISFKNEPSVVDLFSYTYCYAGLFTGPFYTFKTFIDFTKQPTTAMYKNAKMTIETKKILAILVSGLLHILLPKVTNYKLLITSEYSEIPFYYRLLYPFLFLIEQRLKFYSVWLGAELSFQSLNFGAYPEITTPKPGCGPTSNFDQINTNDGRAISFATIKNIEPVELEKAVSVREMMNRWNLSVKWWLGHYVLRRFPVKPLRLPVLLFTSAYLHGVKFGYYLATLSTIPLMKAEEVLGKYIPALLPKRLRPAYTVYAWFMSYRAFEYLSVAFYLDLNEVINIWGFLYWYIHFYAVVVNVFFLIVVGFKKGKISYNKAKSS